MYSVYLTMYSVYTFAAIAVTESDDTLWTLDLFNVLLIKLET